MVEPTFIDPDCFYDEASCRFSLGITGSALAKARKDGELRFTRRGGRTRYLGRWLIDWLTGEAEPQKRRTQAVASC